MADGTTPDDDENSSEVWNNAHTGALEDYKIKDDVNLLYTPEALKSVNKKNSELTNMIDLKSMIQNESVFDVIAFLSGRNEGINYIHLDRFYGQHRFDAIAEGELLLTFQKMCREKNRSRQRATDDGRKRTSLGRT